MKADPRAAVGESGRDVWRPAVSCRQCFLQLATSNVNGVCDDCGDGEQIQRPEPTPVRELKPVTMSQLEKRRLKGLAV